MIRRPPSSTLTDTLCPYPTLFRSHERLIHTMAAGASGIDFGLLVVAADDGIMPQTLEHLAILSILGVAQGAVAVTKADRVDERSEEHTSELKSLMRISYAVFCLKKKKQKTDETTQKTH